MKIMTFPTNEMGFTDGTMDQMSNKKKKKKMQKKNIVLYKKESDEKEMMTKIETI